MFYVIAIGLPFISLSSVINGYFSAVRKTYKSALSQVFELILKIIISIFLLKYLFTANVEIICIYLIAADVISEIFSGMFLYFLYKFEIKQYLVRQTIKEDFKKAILQITLPVAITSYIRSGLSTLKQFIVPRRLRVFGLPYTIALSEYGKITGMALPVIMFPFVFIGSFRFSIGIATILLCFSNKLSFFLFQNIDCAIYIKLLSPLIAFMYLDNIIDNMLKGLNQQIQVMLCNIIDLLISIFLLYFLLPNIGVYGFIITIYVSEIFNFTVSYITLCKHTGFKLFNLFFL